MTPVSFYAPGPGGVPSSRRKHVHVMFLFSFIFVSTPSSISSHWCLSRMDCHNLDEAPETAYASRTSTPSLGAFSASPTLYNSSLLPSSSDDWADSPQSPISHLSRFGNSSYSRPPSSASSLSSVSSDPLQHIQHFQELEQQCNRLQRENLALHTEIVTVRCVYLI